MSDIIIYGKSGCQYCTNAVELLDDRELPYYYYDVQESEENFNRMRVHTSASTLPQIVIDDKLIGGYSDLVRWVRTNAN